MPHFKKYFFQGLFAFAAATANDVQMKAFMDETKNVKNGIDTLWVKNI